MADAGNAHLLQFVVLERNKRFALNAMICYTSVSFQPHSHLPIVPYRQKPGNIALSSESTQIVHTLPAPILLLSFSADLNHPRECQRWSEYAH